MLNLFLIFLKINLLTPSGPASIGLTKELVVPSLISSEKFSQILTITSGIPGSDAIQMAWQIGFATKGIAGAFISVLGALIPCILLASLVMVGLRFVNPDVLNKFINGVKPALVILLIITAFGLLPVSSIWGRPLVVLALAGVMFYMKIPVLLILLASGFIGLL